MLRDDRDHGRRRMNTARNVLGEPLEICSISPMSGFYRDGCCNTGPEDVVVRRASSRVTYAGGASLNDDCARPREKPPHRDVLRQARLRLPHNHMHRRDNRLGVTANMLSASITYDRARRRQVGIVGLALAKLWIW